MFPVRAIDPGRESGKYEVEGTASAAPQCREGVPFASRASIAQAAEIEHRRPEGERRCFLSSTSRDRDTSSSILLLAFVKIAIVLDARDPQSLHAGAIDRTLPRGEFFERKAIARAHVVDG